MFTKNELQEAASLVYRHMPPTPQYCWPLLCERTGATVWVKHENHTPAGAFKIRGGITFIDWLRRTHPDCKGIVTATRGNHGQSQARAAKAAGLSATIIVPHGNSKEKNAAMQAFGATVIEYGEDFDEAKGEAMRRAQEEKLFLVPAFHPALLRGVASYAFEFLSAVPSLHTVYVPIGCGSGICSMIAVRDALGLKTRIVGVVATGAQAAKLSFEQGAIVETETAKTMADGVAVRVPVPEAFAMYSQGAERIVAVSDDEIRHAIRVLYRDTHNVAEGAGAASLAALLQEKETMRGLDIGVILSGGNIDADEYAAILAG